MKFLKSILTIAALVGATAASAGTACAERVPMDAAITNIRLMSEFLVDRHNLRFNLALSRQATDLVRREMSSDNVIAVVNDGTMYNEPVTITLMYVQDARALCVADTRTGTRDWSKELLRTMIKNIPGAQAR